MTSYPDDADGDALRRVASHGSDMSQPMEIDFPIRAPDEASARRIAELATPRGYTCRVWQSDEGDWDCICARSMVPTYDAIVAVQRELDALARPHGAYSDGWGTFGNGDAA